MIVRQWMLGTEAVYRISDPLPGGGRVVAEVIHAPGLEAGTQVRLTARAVRAMEQLAVCDLEEALSATAK